MTKKWLVRYSEIFLKSDPIRRRWENQLMDNIRDVMPDARTRSERGRIWLEGDVDPTLLKNIFGVVSFSKVDHVHIRDLESGLLTFCHTLGMEKARNLCLTHKAGRLPSIHLTGESCRLWQPDPK